MSKLTFVDILDIANSAYQNDDAILQAWDEDNHAIVHDTGDTLAEFIVCELWDMFNSHETELSNITEACRAMTFAMRQMTDVREALMDKMEEMEKLTFDQLEEVPHGKETTKA